MVSLRRCRHPAPLTCVKRAQSACHRRSANTIGSHSASLPPDFAATPLHRRRTPREPPQEMAPRTGPANVEISTSLPNSVQPVSRPFRRPTACIQPPTHRHDASLHDGNKPRGRGRGLRAPELTRFRYADTMITARRGIAEGTREASRRRPRAWMRALVASPWLPEAAVATCISAI